MVKFINKFTGGNMWVADTRVEEYLRMGHKPVNDEEARAAKEAAPRKRRRGKSYELRDTR